MNYFDTKSVGEVLSRVTNDVDTLGQSLNQSATQMITSITTLIGVLIMMLSISPLMTLIAILILPISVILISIVMKHSQKYFRGQQAYLGNEMDRWRRSTAVITSLKLLIRKKM